VAAHKKNADGTSAATIAEALGISEDRLSLYRHGRCMIPDDVGHALATRWGLSLDWLYHGDDCNMTPALLEKMAEVSGTAERGAVAA
jgi:hypothetical protein